MNKLTAVKLLVLATLLTSSFFQLAFCDDKIANYNYVTQEQISDETLKKYIETILINPFNLSQINYVCIDQDSNSNTLNIELFSIKPNSLERFGHKGLGNSIDKTPDVTLFPEIGQEILPIKSSNDKKDLVSVTKEVASTIPNPLVTDSTVSAPSVQSIISDTPIVVGFDTDISEEEKKVTVGFDPLKKNVNITAVAAANENNELTKTGGNITINAGNTSLLISGSGEKESDNKALATSSATISNIAPKDGLIKEYGAGVSGFATITTQADGDGKKYFIDNDASKGFKVVSYTTLTIPLEPSLKVMFENEYEGVESKKKTGGAALKLDLHYFAVELGGEVSTGEDSEKKATIKFSGHLPK